QKAPECAPVTHSLLHTRGLSTMHRTQLGPIASARGPAGETLRPSAIEMPDAGCRLAQHLRGGTPRHRAPRCREPATGSPIGERLAPERAVRVCDANPVHLGHHARADGRWRLYAIADPAAPSADGSALRRWADRMLTAPDS